jgi:hypothetical protein
VLHRSGFAAKVGGADNIDPRKGQQQDVRRPNQAAGEITLQSLNLAGFVLAVVVQGLDNTQVLVGSGVAGGGLVGPIEDGLDGALLETDVRSAERLT